MKINPKSRWLYIVTMIGVAIAIGMIGYIILFDAEPVVIHIP